MRGVGMLGPMSALHCPTCELEVPDGLPFCPRCRARAEGRELDPHEVDRHERAYVLSLVGLSLGVLAIPRALRSRAFGPLGKLGLTLLGIGNTTGALALGWWFFARYLPGALEAARTAR